MGGHGEQWLKVPWLSAVPGGLRSWASPVPRGGQAVKAGTESQAQPHPSLQHPAASSAIGVLIRAD